ncbi:MAG: dynamin family protein [Actinobacteria bacterium]|nr:dynamin family protein [Actinomycetota bacterium]
MSDAPHEEVGRARHGAPDDLVEPATGLVDALVLLRAAVADVGLPLDADGVGAARDLRDGMLDQLDDYLLPRLRAAAAPVLVVLGGSTGAGKSTLLNSLLGEQVSAAGVLRPTTRWPVLVHHPLDARWFAGDRVLPGLARLSAAGDAARVRADDAPADDGRPAGDGRAGGDERAGGAAGGLRLVASTAVPQGLALLDAPDIDSVVAGNRALARQLLGAADLWLFVTTAARYADAVPWELLATAAERRTELALVLDRVDRGDEQVVGDHLRAMLAEHDLAGTAVLVVPAADLVDGLLPEGAVAPVAEWLGALAVDPAARRAVVERTRDGLLSDVLVRAGRLAAAGDGQVAARDRLRSAVDSAYAAAAADVRRATSDASLLRGEVLARWQELVGTGELMRSIEQGVSRLRDRLTAALRGRRAVTPELSDAIGAGIDAVLLDAAQSAAERAYAAWRGDPAGAALLDGLELSRASAGLRSVIAEQVRGWQDDVIALVGEEGAGRRTQARALSYGVNALGVALMLVVFASTAGLTGAEVGIAGGSALLAQRLLEAVFGDDAVRRLTRLAHERLDVRVAAVLAAEAARFTGQLDALTIAGGADLRTAVLRVERAPLPEPVVTGASTAPGRLRGAGSGRLTTPDGGRSGAQGGSGGLRGWWRRVTGRGGDR